MCWCRPDGASRCASPGARARAGARPANPEPADAAPPYRPPQPLQQLRRPACCFGTGAWGVEPPPNNVSFYNNTGYSNGAPSVYFKLVNVAPEATNVTVKNNLAYAPTMTGPKLLLGTGASGLVASNNSTDAQVKSTSPNFATSPPATPADFKITTGSYAIGAGAAVPVWSDFFSVPQTAARDLGAVIH